MNISYSLLKLFIKKFDYHPLIFSTYICCCFLIYYSLKDCNHKFLYNPYDYYF